MKRLEQVAQNTIGAEGELLQQRYITSDRVPVLQADGLAITAVRGRAGLGRVESRGQDKRRRPIQAGQTQDKQAEAHIRARTSDRGAHVHLRFREHPRLETVKVKNMPARHAQLPVRVYEEVERDVASKWAKGNGSRRGVDHATNLIPHKSSDRAAGCPRTTKSHNGSDGHRARVEAFKAQPIKLRCRAFKDKAAIQKGGIILRGQQPRVAEEC